MPSPILARADALMRRRREQGAESGDIPLLIDAVDDDDVPVLLDAEAPPPAGEAPSETPAQKTLGMPDLIVPGATPSLDPALREDIAREIAWRVEARLATELPKIVEAAVRDYLAEAAGDEAARG